MKKVPTLYNLSTAVKVFVAKGDASRDRSEEFYAKAGLKLAELKKRKPKDQTWPAFVKAQCGLSQQRADELIRIGKGTTTVEAVRERSAASAKKSRAKSMTRIIDPPAAKRPEPFPPFERGKGCDYDPTSQDQIESEPYRVTRARGYFASVEEAVRLARENLFVINNRAAWATIDPNEITPQVIEAAQNVADAWLECVRTLHRLAEGKAHDKETGRNSLGASLH